MRDMSQKYTWNLRVRSRLDRSSQKMTLGLAGTFVDLDPIASSMWLGFESPATVQEVADAIAVEYSADPEVVVPDVEEFVQTMRDTQMLHDVGGT